MVTRRGHIRSMGQRAALSLKRLAAKGGLRLPRALLRWIARGGEQPFSWRVGGRNIFVRVADHTRKGSLWLSLEEPGAILESLTEGETAVLRWVSYGKTDEQIAQFETMKLSTLKKCLKRIFDKLGVPNRAAAVAAYARLMAKRGS